MADQTGKQAAEGSWLHKCLTCRHVYQRPDDADTLYCRCGPECRYEKAGPERDHEEESSV